jgi:hypothetical protein
MLAKLSKLQSVYYVNVRLPNVSVSVGVTMLLGCYNVKVLVRSISTSRKYLLSKMGGTRYLRQLPPTKIK